MIPSTWCMQRKAGTEQAKKNQRQRNKEKAQEQPPKRNTVVEGFMITSGIINVRLHYNKELINQLELSKHVKTRKIDWNHVI